MRIRVLHVLAAALLAGGAVGVLASRAATPTANPPVTPPAPSTPADQRAPDQQPVVAPDSVPLGFDVRYVDENGKFVTITPEDFPR